MIVDLHLHTTYSDGMFTPRQVVDMAKEKGLCAVAITDHDECRGYLDVAEEKDITVVSGIELSAHYHGEAHVLGYGIDCLSTALVDHIEKQNESRRNRALKMVEKFKDEGIELSMEEVIEQSGEGVIGRPHIADILVKKGVVSSPKEAFSRFLDRHARCYIPREKVDAEKAAELILSAGGKPVLAHPGLIPGSVWKEFSGRLRELGFWGIEAYHPSHTPGQCRSFESFARQNGLFVTSGSDFHGSIKPGIEIGQERRGNEYLRESLEKLGVKCKFDDN